MIQIVGAWLVILCILGIIVLIDIKRTKEEDKPMKDLTLISSRIRLLQQEPQTKEVRKEIKQLQKDLRSLK